MRSIRARLAEAAPTARLSLPDGVVLGTTTMEDVVRVKGPPFDTDLTEGENIAIYSYRYSEGGEGLEVVSVSVSVSGECGRSDDLGGFNALRRRLVESFKMGYWEEVADQREAFSDITSVVTHDGVRFG